MTKQNRDTEECSKLKTSGNMTRWGVNGLNIRTYIYILVNIANSPLLYWRMNIIYFRSMQLLKEWPWHRQFGKSWMLALLSYSLVSHIPYYINFRFNNGPNMSSVLSCILRQFGRYTLKVFLQKYFVLWVREVCKRF